MNVELGETVRLFETLLWRPKSGFFLEVRHLDRLTSSARLFAWPVVHADLQVALRQAEEAFRSEQPPARKRLRLLADRKGHVEWQATTFPCSGRTSWNLALDDGPTNSTNFFLRHKTTEREIYEQALKRRPDHDDVLLFNERGELTESTRANLVLKIDGSWLTPAASCGLLPGTYRAELLERGRLREAILPIATLRKAEGVFLINSVRGFIRACIDQGSIDQACMDQGCVDQDCVDQGMASGSSSSM